MRPAIPNSVAMKLDSMMEFPYMHINYAIVQAFEYGETLK